MKKILAISAFIFICMIFLYPSTSALAADGGLIPCGNGENDPCTLCHFVIGFQGVVDKLVSLVITIALAGIFISGVMYVISAGDDTMMKNAKSGLTASAIGFAIVMGAWLIVNVSIWVLGAKIDVVTGKKWYEISCSTTDTPTISSMQAQAQAIPLISCGINDIGVCKPGIIVGTCPSGFSATTGSPLKPCASTTKCCVKDGESSEKCAFGEGKCFYGMSFCPSGYNHKIGLCTASQSICCKQI